MAEQNKETHSEKTPTGAPDLLQAALALHRQGRLKDACVLYGQILKGNPEDAEALHLLGIARFQSGELSAAEDLLGKAVDLCPARADFRCSLGNILKSAGKTDAAIRMFEEALRLDPGYAEAHNNLGATLTDAGRHAEAIGHLWQALNIRPDYAEASYNLGNAYRGLKDIDKAIAYYNQAIKNGCTDAYVNLGLTLMDIGNEVDAIGYFKQAIKLKSSLVEAYNNLGSALTSQGNMVEALPCYRKCLEIDPALHKTHSNLLLALHYTDAASPEELFLEHKQWASIHARPITASQSWENDKKPDRVLRIGYVSPDLHAHPVAHFIEPVLAGHDRHSFEIYCYSDSDRPDHVTERIKALPVVWRDIGGMSDETVAHMILRERIDILVDLAGHTANNRLKVFARQPAPIQATYLGYPDTTGLTTMDYRLVDAVTDPPGSAEGLNSEQLARMPHGFLCYRPPHGTPEPGPLPALTSGGITFGCFNKRAKITPAAVTAWSCILDRIPGSRMLLKFKNFLSAEEQAAMQNLFMDNGIAPDRVEILKPIQSLEGHIGMYAGMDIALDTFPYNGTTTTCEALWMGVPVITLRGVRHASRVGASILMNAGLTDLIAGSVSEYIAKAVMLSGDIERLATLRAGLRDTLERSALRDEKGFVADLEDCYRMMWRRWCENATSSPRDDTPSNKPLSGIEQLLIQGEALFNAGHVNEAERAFRIVLATEPENVTAMNNLGVIHWHTGKINLAIETFKTILAIDPGFLDARINLEAIGRLDKDRKQDNSNA